MSTSVPVIRERAFISIIVPWIVLLVLTSVAAPARSAPPNKPPTVLLIAPTSGATFTAPATITVSASASDSDGAVARVDFYQGASLIGTRTTAPYTITWSGVAAGRYSLTAQAVDNAGASRMSSAVSITVTGARVIIGSPANGSVVYGSSVTVSGSFTGATDSTVLVDNGNTTRLATLNGNSYSAAIPVDYGVNTLHVVVARRDKSSDSASVVVTGNTNPLIMFTAPATTVFNALANVGLVVDALSPSGTIAKVDFFRNGTLLATATAPPYQYNWANVSAGSYTITATATDTDGHVGSAYLAVTVNGPNLPPTVSLTAPANGASFTAPANIVLTASANDSDGWVTMVEFLQNNSVIGVTNTTPFSMTWNTVAAGTYTLTARATDNRLGAATSAPVAITVGATNAPPTVSLTSPSSGSTFVAPATISLAANASDSDGSVVGVDFYRGATLIASSTAAPYAATWPNVAAGSYALTAKATDDRGAVTTSSPVNVVVSANSPPSVALTSPYPGAAYVAPATILLNAAVSDSDGTIVRVDYYQGATLIGSTTVAPYAYTWSNVTSGMYSLTARAMDNQGATSTSAAVTIKVSGPTLAISSPANNATISGDSVTVTGTLQGPANSGVTVNGIVAAIDGTGHFYANGVPLTPGANAINATLTTLDGQIATQSIMVSSSGAAPIRIVASPTQGLAPLSVVFDVSAQSGVTIQKFEIDADSSGTVDQTLVAAPWTATAVYSGSGVVNALVRVTDTSGSVFTQTIPLVLVNESMLDQTLRTVWSGMKSALAAGNKDGAMRYLDASAQQRFGPVFDALLSRMSQITATFSDLQTMTLSDGLGEYAINRTINGENRIFFLYFGRNGDGVWRLGSM